MRIFVQAENKVSCKNRNYKWCDNNTNIYKIKQNSCFCIRCLNLPTHVFLALFPISLAILKGHFSVRVGGHGYTSISIPKL